MTSLARSQIEANPQKLVSVLAAPEHEVQLLSAVAAPWRVLCDAARRDGIALFPVSGFRSVDRQTAIWNRQFEEHCAQGLDASAAVAKILEYSAPPGWSRHHWGTEIDLISQALTGTPRLDPKDWQSGGPLAETGAWLEANAPEYGFLRPYDRPRGGFFPEPWHWSFAPFALPQLARMEQVDWRTWLSSGKGDESAAGPFAGAPLLLEDLEQKRRRFFYGINPRLIPA
ncbi:MAG: M15 family metallopeptidase [Planctomycetota bacterium]